MMRLLLENLIPGFLSFILFIILALTLIILFINHRKIKQELIVYRYYYIILLLLLIIGSFIRLSLVNSNITFLGYDNVEYVVQAYGISEYGRFSFVCDPPLFPVLVAYVYGLLGFNFYSTSLVNAFFGSLTIFAVFLFVRILFQNHLAGLLSSFILSLFPYHIAASIIALPLATSIFFLLFGFVIFLLALNKKSRLYFLLSGLVFGCAVQIYYIEVIMIGLFMLLLAFRRKLKLIFSPSFLMFVLAIVFVVIPFLFLEHLSDNKECGTYYHFQDAPNNFVCALVRNFCKVFSLDFWINKAPYGETQFSDIDGNLPASLAFTLADYKLKDAPLYNMRAWVLKDYPYTTFSFVTLFFSLLIISFIFSQHKNRNAIFLFVLLLLYILAISLYYNFYYVHILPIQVIAYIPLVSLAISYLFGLLGKNIRYILIILIVFLVLSHFFMANTYQQLNMFKNKEILLRGCVGYEAYNLLCKEIMDHYDSYRTEQMSRIFKKPNIMRII